MGDPDEMKRAASELYEGLVANVKPEILYLLWDKLQAGVSGFSYPQFEALTVDEDDNIRPLAFECPHCLREIPPHEVSIIEAEAREVEVNEVNEEDGQLWFEQPDGSCYEDIVLICPRCKNAVDLPEDWSHEWQ